MEEEETVIPLKGGTIKREASFLSEKLHYSADVIRRLGFFYGFSRSVKLIKALKRPPSHLSIRINTLKKKPEAVLDSLKSVKGVNVSSSVFEDVLCVEVEGPFEVPNVEYAIIAKDKSAEKVMLGANLYAPGIMRLEGEVKRGEKVNVTTQFGEVIALGEANVSSTTKKMPNLVVHVEKSKYRLINLEDLEAFQKGWAYPAPVLSTQALKWFDPLEEEILCVFPEYEDLAYLISLSSGEAHLTVMVESQTEKEMITKGLRDLKMGKWEEKIRWIRKGESLPDEHFDAVLACPKASKIGIRPRISGYLKEQDIVRLSREARRLLREITPAIKKGGRLLFLVPSLDPAECEVNVNYFVQELGFELFTRERKIGHPGVENAPHSKNVLRSYPDQDEDEGWFTALLFK